MWVICWWYVGCRFRNAPVTAHKTKTPTLSLHHAPPRTGKHNHSKLAEVSYDVATMKENDKHAFNNFLNNKQIQKPNKQFVVIFMHINPLTKQCWGKKKMGKIIARNYNTFKNFYSLVESAYLSCVGGKIKVESLRHNVCWCKTWRLFAFRPEAWVVG